MLNNKYIYPYIEKYAEKCLSNYVCVCVCPTLVAGIGAITV